MTQITFLSGFDASEYALRTATQTLEPIPATVQVRRTVNGTLVDVSATQFRKYRSTIRSNDHVPPAFNDFWPGMTIICNCAVELSYRTGSGAPDRTVVSGSSRTDGDFTFYRPQITFRGLSFTWEYDEWGARNSWSLEMEEV